MTYKKIDFRGIILESFQKMSKYLFFKHLPV